MHTRAFGMTRTNLAITTIEGAHHFIIRAIRNSSENSKAKPPIFQSSNSLVLEDAKCKKAQRDNGQCLPDYVALPNHAYLKKALGPSVIYSVPSGRPVETSDFVFCLRIWRKKWS